LIRKDKAYELRKKYFQIFIGDNQFFPVPTKFAVMPKTKRNKKEVQELLDEMERRFNRPDFIENDPVSIPHMFRKKQDVEIAGLIAAVLAWGQRVTIIRKSKELMEMMGNSPFDFILNHSDKDLKTLMSFKHRTFNTTDTLYFIEFLKWFYSRHASLEEAFYLGPDALTMETGLIRFQKLFFSLQDAPDRTRKHVPTPERKSTCKRLNMYLRWMVRKDDRGVDFGLWQNIRSDQLICPCDVHVDRVARNLKLIRRKQTDWLTALELTESLRMFDSTDPVKYDFALFGMGVEKVRI
jgi:uncharacterized protein (TIGR02757 family)